MFGIVFTVLKFLGAIPGISHVVGFAKEHVAPHVSLKGKSRLVIEYVLLAVLIAAATLSVTLWLQRERVEQKLEKAGTEIEGLQGRLSGVEIINERQQATIKSLEGLREQDAKALTGLNDDYQSLAARDERVRQQIRELEKQNAQVRLYLDQPVPPELGQLLQQ